MKLKFVNICYLFGEKVTISQNKNSKKSSLDLHIEKMASASSLTLLNYTTLLLENSTLCSCQSEWMPLKHHGGSSQSGQATRPALCSPHDLEDSRESAFELLYSRLWHHGEQPCVHGTQGPGTCPRETAQSALDKVRWWQVKGTRGWWGGHILQERDRGKGPGERWGHTVTQECHRLWWGGEQVSIT